MKGKIISCPGNEVVASISFSGKSLDLKTAKGLCGRPVSLENESAVVGRISNVIGRVDKPYLVITKYKKKVSPELINKPIYIKWSKK
ncbi:MAG: hypothetical protein U9Q22_05335 [Candidatus Altiarchaeota archaeon]|nr:hypothetical protein [Candidatus Altiarchaeota archaeon]